MNREDVLRIAEKCGASIFRYPDKETSVVIGGKYGSGDGTEFVMKFANAIAAHERSICADIAANQRDGEDITEAWKHCSRFIEQRIRARD